ncbi:cation-translocating P-type ATPase [Microbacterium sp. NC79]|uniref:heavy metal translocating P-type ATPase n=1 Tax=Microbacterium sp. NC79 TaxID=2851009 RepID=UPI001C2C8885|nr:heavy metal translocating P-type ATPase [Microbacterium sp. NC79]MBV0895262.1 heavy metal translocating P-type ATPase [Microbacterium sp. NC79]
MSTALHTDDELRAATLDIEGMTCASCVARVEKRLSSVAGVQAAVNLATESAKVSIPVGVSDDDLIAAVESAGYGARVRAVGSQPAAMDEHDHTDEGRTKLGTRLVVSAILAIPVIATGMVPALQFPGWQWMAMILTLPIVMWGGWPFHRATFQNARHFTATMDTLITLGTSAALIWSVWAMFFGTAGEIGMTHDVVLFGPVHDATSLVYFEVAAGVTVFLLLGRWIEHRSKRRAGDALRTLMNLGAKAVTLATVAGADGPTVPIDDLQVGDRFVARPGEKIATDGVVVSGSAAVDASMLSGESEPIAVSAGSFVTGSTIATDGRLVVEATAVGENTRLAAMARLVEEAQTGKSAVQRLADRISGVFVPVVIVLSIVTLIAWLVFDGSVAAGFTAAVAVLIIACPCALGLATPVAILVGTGRGAQMGILITGPEAIESAGGIDTLFADKTGTITTGTMTLVSVATVDGVDTGAFVSSVASVESSSEHPVARAIVAAATEVPVATDFTSVAGRGVSGTVEGVRVFARRLDAGELETLPENLAAAVRAAGTTTIVAGRLSDDAETIEGVLFVADAVRDDSALAVQQLQKLGVEVRMLTGDNEAAAQRAATAVGIAHITSGVTPEGKIDAVRAAQAAGKSVAMVGDGVNDAPALAAADLGLAMGGGTDAAMHASDITLVRQSLSAAADAIRLSRKTMSTIRGNLFWAFGYNVAAIPLAALGLLNPMLAGAAMAFSSVFVVLNSLRLRAFR